ncbi:hypothetical protein GCM10022240_27130 [Microbacterium kribbense]|uniref:Uncharacterized protein n=1 Tax=Microbacterium kribbense TaxID=433645 RepID=A0ABP7GS63_9MICO
MPTPAADTAVVAPLLISLAGVAELAGVQRAVASMWRTRARKTDAPFPPAVAQQRGRNMFDAHAVARWLVETGHGHNPDAVADAAAFADGVAIDFSDAADVAELEALIALRAQSGATLADASRDDLRALAAAADPDDSQLRSEIERHLTRDAVWTGYADQLIDAAYSADAALARIQRRAAHSQRAHGSAGALDRDARDLVAALVQALVAQAARTPAVCIAPGVDAALFDTVTRTAGDEVDIAWDDGFAARALRRAKACRGIPIDVGGRTGTAVVLARMPVVAGASVASMLTTVDELGLSLEHDDLAVVVGPARALVDALPTAHGAARADTLRTGRVRAIVRLDAGHVTSASREALALWVFGPGTDIALGDRVIALADLTGMVLTPATVADLISDILANLGGPVAARAHAFRFARLQRTSSVLARSGALVVDAPRRGATPASASRELPALLDAAIAAAAGDAPALAVAVTPQALAEPKTMTVDAAVSNGHARVLPGTRIGADEFGDTGLAVVTIDDLDDAAQIGAHRIDHLAFAAAHPRAQLTRPGDVVFRTAPTPRAWVDAEGSRVVAYPARVLRIAPADPGGLVPDLVAADIRTGVAGPGAWRRWRIRVVDPAQLRPLRAALAAASITRRELQQRIARLDQVTDLLADAVAARAVTISNDRPTR